jgi:hypothetical protein
LSRTPAPRIGVIVAIISLLLVSDAHAQTVPFIGSIIWTHNGYDSEAQRSRYIEAIDQAIHAGIYVIGTNTHHNTRPADNRKSGELLTIDERTGTMLRVDSVCPQFRASNGSRFSLRTATIDDSATVICYTCYADGVHLATWPDLVPIIDTMLRGWSRAWLSNTGRYMILEREHPDTRLSLFAYDRQTGDTVYIDAITEATYNGPEFTADDKYVLTHRSDQNATLLNVLDLENMHAPAKVFRVGEWSYMQLSYRGNKLLYAADGAVGVIDVETGERIWGISQGEYPIFNLFISADGTEVFLLRDAAAASPKFGGLAILRYHPPSVDPDGILAQGEIDPGSLWIASPLYPQTKIPGRFVTVLQTTTTAGYFSHETRTGVLEESDPFMPILYPNPATSSVTMQVGACTDASWVVTIHDQSGSRLLERTVACQSGALRFDVTGLSAGSYVVRAMVPMSRQMATAMLIVR